MPRAGPPRPAARWGGAARASGVVGPPSLRASATTGDATLGGVDATLARVDGVRRATRVAGLDRSVESAVAVYRHDFVLQGRGETVSFEP